MIEAPHFVYDVVAMMLLASLGILFFGLMLTRPLVRSCRCRAIYCHAGGLRALHGRLLRHRRRASSTSGRCSASASSASCCASSNYPMAPLVLGIVLGDLLDKNFRRGLVLSDGSFLPLPHPPDQPRSLAADRCAILLTWIHRRRLPAAALGRRVRAATAASRQR